jgi:hypothetical protein
MNPIKLSASELKEIKAEPFELELILQEGDKVTHSGVLVPEENYRYYQSMIYQNTVLQKSINDCVDLKTDFDPKLPFAGGVFVGVLVTAILVMTFKH